MLPAVAEVTVLARIPLPVSGLFTVTENVIVADAPTARFPVQVRLGLAKARAGGGGRAAVVGGVIQHPGQRVGDRGAGVRDLPGVGDRDRVIHDATGCRPAVFAVADDVHAGVSTLRSRHGGVAVTGGSSDPAGAMTVLTISTLSPVSGLFTVTEYVMVTVAPTARLPVQVRSGLVYCLSRRSLGVAVVGGVIQHPVQRVGHRDPGVRGLPGVGDVTV